MLGEFFALFQFAHQLFIPFCFLELEERGPLYSHAIGKEQQFSRKKLGHSSTFITVSGRRKGNLLWFCKIIVVSVPWDATTSTASKKSTVTGGSSSSTVVENLRPYTQYKARVKATNDLGIGDASNVIVVSPASIPASIFVMKIDEAKAEDHPQAISSPWLSF